MKNASSNDMIRKKDCPDIKLTRVVGNTEDIEILFQLLRERDFSISHASLPSIEEHKYFVKNNPYRIWYIVNLDSIPIGTIYLLKDNSIGLFLKKKYLNFTGAALSLIIKKHKPLQPIKSVRGNNFHINTNPNDIEFISALKEYGLKHIQSTYSL